MRRLLLLLSIAVCVVAFAFTLSAQPRDHRTSPAPADEQRPEASVRSPDSVAARQAAVEHGERLRQQIRERITQRRDITASSTLRGLRSIGPTDPAPSTPDPSLTIDKDLGLGAASNIFKAGSTLLWDDAAGNLALGRSALTSNSIGGDNTAVGYRALYSNGTGESNVAVGTRALFNDPDGARNTAVGSHAAYASYAGYSNTALGSDALRNSTGGMYNTAAGFGAMSDAGPGYYNTAAGSYALRDNYASYNTATGALALRENNSGHFNTATGFGALRDNYNGEYNTAVGFDALRSTFSGRENTAVGATALANTYSYHSEDEGRRNAALGFQALNSNTSGNYNTAVGGYALRSAQTASRNTAVGESALGGYAGKPGSDNTALGFAAGDRALVGGVYNIHIGSNVLGSGDTYTTRIGNVQTRAYMAGIYATPVVPPYHVAYVNSFGKLGLPASSRQFKTDIEDLGERSDAVLKLRPVSFRLQDTVEIDGGARQWGLLAEEVAAVLPELVVYDDKGQPRGVRYNLLSTLLLNELKEQRNEVDELRARLARLEAQRRE